MHYKKKMMTNIEETNTIPNAQGRTHTAKRVTIVGLLANIFLSVLKLATGIIGNSGAMIADGIHSISDFITDIIVLIFLNISAKKSNDRYRYGYGKFETLATVLISIALLVVAIGLFVNSFEQIIAAINGQVLPPAEKITLYAAIISILSKEWLFRYTKHHGEKLNCETLIANAWHHRSDALSSIAVMIGIGGSLILGKDWRILDPIAACLVSILIFIVALRLIAPSINELLEVSLPEEVNDRIKKLICRNEKVKAFHHLRTRKNGNEYIIDFHIKVNPDMKVKEAHDVANDIEQSIQNQFGNNSIINIHIEPYKGESTTTDKICKD